MTDVRDPAPTVHFPRRPLQLGGGIPFRTECELTDCDVIGEIPADLDGAFYRVGPDYQYPPLRADNIPFDGEGHVGMFRIKGGHVDYKSRYVRTQRYKAQKAARRALFGMYRNPFTDDPSVKGLSRGTANTHIVDHGGYLFALKEDSPPVRMDLNTLETLDDYCTFDDTLASLTFTAHPKFDYRTGEMIAFGYEAKGLGTDDVAVFSVGADMRIGWTAWVKTPFTGMLHDFAVTEAHIAFFLTPLKTDMQQIESGGLHFSYDSALPSYLGVMKRGGDGSDMRWFRGPEHMATHTMGCWSEGDRIHVDMDMGTSNQFPFFPNTRGEQFNPHTAAGKVTRVWVDTNQNSDEYHYDILFDGVTGILPRQDDRFHTVKYRYGYMPGGDPRLPLHEQLQGRRMNNIWIRVDHETGTHDRFFAGPNVGLQEMCFVPRNAQAGEGDGYLVGIGDDLIAGTSQLYIVDCDRMADGPVATVSLPFMLYGQVHGWWVPGDRLSGD